MAKHPRAQAAVTDYLTSCGIVATAGVAWTIRSGKAAKSATDRDFSLWWAQAVTARDTADAAVAVLVVQRPHYGTGNWWAAMDIATLIALASDEIAAAAYASDAAPNYLIRMTLAAAVQALRWAGYSSP